MSVQVHVERNHYVDSVSLMASSEGVRAVPGVTEAVLVMGTPMNHGLLERVGLLTPEALVAGPMDLIIAVKAEDAAAAAAGIAKARSSLAGGAPSGAPAAAIPAQPAPTRIPRTFREAVAAEPDLEVAFISVPGPYAAYEARTALGLGLDVMLFSNNVSVETEVELKRFAAERGRLCMGPDCGTVLANGFGLGFANSVRRGDIGIVAASGTGSQELSVLIDRLGAGISHLIGVGGRDLSAEVGGLMSIAAFGRFERNARTKYIVLIAKPPAPEIRAKIEARAAASTKPVLLCFLDGTGSIDETAAQAVHLSTGRPLEALRAAISGMVAAPEAPGRVIDLRAERDFRRTKVVGLFSGGSLCDQALGLLSERLGSVSQELDLYMAWMEGREDWEAQSHYLIDLGAEEFTRGRPHPMIDFGLRRELIRWAADRPTTGAILLDTVLGWGAHPDPAGAMAESIEYASWQRVPVIASVTGTETDPQGYSRQVATLQAAGATVYPTARQAALATARLIQEGRDRA